MAKKSFYLFLTALLGTLLFLILDRIGTFIYLYAIAGGYINPNISFDQFFAVDYFLMTLVMMLGAWYGIWVGLYWYEKVYEQKSHYGFIDHISKKYFPPKRNENLDSKMALVKRRLETDLWELEDLAQAPPVLQKPAPIKRKVVRKKAPKKLNSL